MIETVRVDRRAIENLWPALALLRETCAAERVDFFVIGAAALDLLLRHVHGVRHLRTTKDVDAAIAVASWDEYDAVLARLCEAHGFEPGRAPHRVRRDDLILDIVPFGEITEGGHTVAWPEHARPMSVLGYDEVYEAAVGIVADDGPPVRVASLPGLAILKLIAWNEAPRRRRKDAADLCTIMMAYHDVAGGRLYDEHADLLEEETFDYRVAGARIYGRDVAPLLRTSPLREHILVILEENATGEGGGLVQAMGAACHADYAFRLRQLQAFYQGLRERTSRSAD
ncbi:MAG: hypothetical protein GVY18_15365 [Bacteroidetes bacterium]|jgi:predicted nucleotidyltransferase|nr:hypothetical protein [Bacteroidota bacterium]